MHPIVQTLTLVAADDNGVCESQALGAAGNLTLDGALVAAGVATLDSGGAARRLIITSAGDDSTLTWLISGTIRDPGNPTNVIAATESLAGANVGDAMSLKDWLTITAIHGSKAAAGAVTAGTNGWASAPAVPLDTFSPEFLASASGVVLSGDPTYQLEVTPDDIFGTWLQPGQTVQWLVWSDLTAKHANAQTILSATNGPVPVRAARWTVTNGGSLRGTILQQRSAA